MKPLIIIILCCLATSCTSSLTGNKISFHKDFTPKSGYLYSSPDVRRFLLKQGIKTAKIDLVCALELHYEIFWCAKELSSELFYLVKFDREYFPVKKQITLERLGHKFRLGGYVFDVIRNDSCISVCQNKKKDCF